MDTPGAPRARTTGPNPTRAEVIGADLVALTGPAGLVVWRLPTHQADASGPAWVDLVTAFYGAPRSGLVST